MPDETTVIERLRSRLPPAPRGEVWAGDDAAVVREGHGPMLLAADLVVAGVHADLELVGLDDVGWKALAVNVSDIAAMGGRATHALVSVVLPGAEVDLDLLYDGLLAAARAYDCPIVGGDLSAGPELVVSVAVTGALDGPAPPVLRSGARPGDTVFVTGPLGRSALGLRQLRAGKGDGLPHRRPAARVGEGVAARAGGATAMIDVSDGLALDLRRLADASRAGVALATVPVAEGATLDDALGGGEDYELLFTAPDAERLQAAFAQAGLDAPLVIGRCTADVAERTLDGERLPDVGWNPSWR